MARREIFGNEVALGVDDVGLLSTLLSNHISVLSGLLVMISLMLSEIAPTLIRRVLNIRLNRTRLGNRITISR